MYKWVDTDDPIAIIIQIGIVLWVGYYFTSEWGKKDDNENEDK